MHSLQTTPSVSIGLPVYNGENYLAATLASILAQSYRDFDLLISDNGSTDATYEIALHYAAQDARVRVVRHTHNLGAAANFNYVFDQTHAPIFKWAAHDDLLAPSYLEACMAALATQPDAVLAYPRAYLLNADDAPIATTVPRLTAMHHPQPHVRLADVLLTPHWSLEVFGLIRRDALARTQLITPAVMSDKRLLAELALQGPWVDVEQTLFGSRDHPHRSVRAIALHRRAVWFSPSHADARLLPHWQTLRSYAQAIDTAAQASRPLRLTQDERRRCQRVLLRWIMAQRNWAWLLLDPFIALMPKLGDWLWQAKLTRWRKQLDTQK